MTGRGLRRMLALVAGIALPSAGVVIFLYATGRLDPRTAAIAFVVAVGLTALAALPAALRLSVVRAWRGAEALGNEARARLLAAEAVIAGLPDPLILLDANRRIVRANAASVELIGTVPEARDLAASLRNPAVLAAADAVLRGEAARVVEFSLTLPV